jgi:hypothetical protein
MQYIGKNITQAISKGNEVIVSQGDSLWGEEQ